MTEQNTQNNDMMNEETNKAADSSQGNVEDNIDAPAASEAEQVEVSPEDKIKALEAELAEQKNEFLRYRADLENTRKRVERDKQAFIKYGLEGILKDMLPCLDSFEQAILQSSSEESVEKLKEGVVLVKKQLVEVLTRHGLTQVESEGASFDPDLHQAIRKEESEDVKQETVGQVYQHGFLLHDRLLRPAMVSVLMPKS